MKNSNIALYVPSPLQDFIICTGLTNYTFLHLSNQAKLPMDSFIVCYKL
jgi:hypothetical protein